MIVQQLSVKVAAAPGSEFDLTAAIQVFHDWIRDKQFPGELLLDVADYRHVPDGPGVVLIGDQIHMGLDQGGGRLGFVCSRRRDQPGPVREKVIDVLNVATAGCELLEATSPLRFRFTDLEVRMLSRLFGDNDGAYQEEFSGAIRTALAGVLGLPEGDFDIVPLGGPGEPLGVAVRVGTDLSPSKIRTQLDPAA